MSTTPTLSLAQYIAKTRYENLSPELVREAKRHLADVLACGLSGATTPSGRAMRVFAEQMTGKNSHVTLWGSKEKANAAIAALSNATMTYHLELDDVHRTSHAHPGISVVPGALAVCEDKKLSPKDLITAIVVGYDIVTRVGMAVSPSIYVDRVFLAPGTLSSWGAAGAVTSLMRLSEEETAKVLGVAAFLSPLCLFESFAKGAPIKNMAMGWGNLIAIWGVLFSSEGLFGPVTALEGQFGYANATADTYDFTRMDAAENYNCGILNTGLKPYSCCRQHHAAIDAMIELRNKHDLKPEQVEHVLVKTFAVASRGNNKTPATTAAATYSCPFSVATALVYGNCWREQYTVSAIQNKTVLDLAAKIDVVKDDELDALYDEKWPAIVEVKTKDGRNLSARWDLMKGEPEHPVSDDELKFKFMSLAADCLDKAQAEDLWSAIYDLENLKNISEMTKLLVK
ncbi:2-methylcitrate dehydratase [Deltaproteobacteria bacterium]|nr:2-methylcitrate dehydratase [Deltaproteobacteria bacterium]